MSSFTFLRRAFLCLCFFSINNLAFAICNATYNPTTGRLVIPCVDVPVPQPFGGTQIQTYSVELQQHSSGYVFDLDPATVKQSTGAVQYSVGSTGPAGGIVFSVDSSGLHGLEAQAADYNVGGVVVLSGSHGFTWSEAKTVAGSYGSGWYLPTKDELNLLYQQKAVVGGFADNNYWSSTEYDASTARNQDFYSGSQDGTNKGGTLLVRAVRAF